MAGLRTARVLVEQLSERSPERVESAEASLAQAAERGTDPTDALVADGLITSLDVARAIAGEWGLDVVELARGEADPVAMRELPLALSRRHGVVVIAADSESVTLATTEPGDIVAIDDVRAATGRAPKLVIAPADDLRRALDGYSQSQNALGFSGDGSESPSDAPLVESDEPVIRYVSELLRRAISNGASDVHIEPLDDEVRVRFRIDGVLHEVESMPSGVVRALITRLKVMASLDIAERRMPQNGRISFPHDGRVVDLRLATMPTVRGEKAVLRVLDNEQGARRMDSLGLTKRHSRLMRTALEKPHGLILVTGPTGSGKSTTLYAALQQLSRPEVNIITVEDPVEYRLDGVNQMQINPKAGLTFVEALPALLRADPDVLLVGEIRDRQTAQLAIEAALTGHLVLTTLHTNDAPSAPTRLREMGIEPFLLGASLDLVAAQRLARRLCTWCREEYAPTADELDRLGWPIDRLDAPDTLYKPVGCRMCAETGYRGRVALHEMMAVSEEIEGLIVSGAATLDLRRAAESEGMRSLRDDGFVKARDGVTTAIEVLRVAR